MPGSWPEDTVVEQPLMGRPAVASQPASVAPPAALVPARVALWHGARERGETGVEAADGWAAFALYEVPAIPDFSSARFPDLAPLDEAQRVQRIGQRQSQWLASLYPSGERCAVSLRYCSEQKPGQEARIRLFVIGRCFGDTPAEARADLLRFQEQLSRSFPLEYPLQEIAEVEDELIQTFLFPSTLPALAEVLKPEQAITPWHDPALCGFPFYYVPLPFQAADNNMLAVCHAMTQDAGLTSHRTRRVMLDITLQPALPLTTVERTEVSSWSALCERWGREQRMQVPGGLYSKPKVVEIDADPQAQEAKKVYADLLARYGSPQSRLFLYAIRVLAEDRDTCSAMANALAARSLVPGSGHQLIVQEAGHPAFERALRAVHFSFVSPSVCNEPLWQHPQAPETLRRLHRMADVKEIGGFFRLPVAGREGCPGMTLDAGLPAISAGPKPAKAVTAAVTLGRLVQGGRVTREEAAFAPEALAKHALIVGTPGSGKTTLCFSLLTQLWRLGIPFLVLEPAKTEYRALLELPGLKDDLLVFTVGNERTAPFRFNPLQVPTGVAVSEHISTLSTCFSGAFSLHDPLPMLLDEALRETYQAFGWSEYEIVGDEAADEATGREFPTLGDLKSEAMRVAERSSYKGELAGNIRAALETRLGSLTRGPKGRCFNTRRGVSLDTLMQRPVILEMEGLSDEEKALTMMFLLSSVRAYARTTRRSGAPLSHVCLVEEAHAVIGRGDGQGSGDRANPQSVSLRFFVRMLAEMRALGEGLVVADQLPTAVAPEALKLTGLKVMHRLVSLEDRQELGQAMVLDGGQMEQAATLPPGVSLMFQEGWPKSRLVQEPDFKGEHAVDVPPEDTAVRAHMEPFMAGELAREAYLPYAGCGEVCQMCTPLVREQRERWAARKLPLIQKRTKKSHGNSRIAALEEYLHGLELPVDDEVGWHCAHVHFGAQVLAAMGSKEM